MLRIYSVASWFNLADEACEDALYGVVASIGFCNVERDSEMHQSFNAGQWYFGMKTHIGVDNTTGLVHSASVTAAN